MSDINVDVPGFEGILKKLQEMQEGLQTNNAILVGLPSETGTKEHPNSKLNNATIGAIHEFGAPEKNIPERSFLRAGLDQNKKTLTKATEKMLHNVLEGRINSEQGMNVVGGLAAAGIKKYMAEGIAPPLKRPRKTGIDGLDKPLIDTGELRASITWVLADMDEVEEGI